MSLEEENVTLISPGEAAKILGYNNTQCIGKLVDAGLLQPFFTPLSKRRRYKKVDVVGLIMSQAPKNPIYDQ